MTDVELRKMAQDARKFAFRARPDSGDGYLTAGCADQLVDAVMMLANAVEILAGKEPIDTIKRGDLTDEQLLAGLRK
jgi:hypothetical protein